MTTALLSHTCTQNAQFCQFQLFHLCIALTCASQIYPNMYATKQFQERCIVFLMCTFISGTTSPPVPQQSHLFLSSITTMHHHLSTSGNQLDVNGLQCDEKDAIPTHNLCHWHKRNSLVSQAGDRTKEMHLEHRIKCLFVMLDMHDVAGAVCPLAVEV